MNFLAMNGDIGCMFPVIPFSSRMLQCVSCHKKLFYDYQNEDKNCRSLKEPNNYPSLFTRL